MNLRRDNRPVVQPSLPHIFNGTRTIKTIYYSNHSSYMVIMLDKRSLVVVYSYIQRAYKGPGGYMFSEQME